MTSHRKLFVENQMRRRSLTSDINGFIDSHPETKLSASDIRTITDKCIEWNSCYSKSRTTISFLRKVLYYIAERMYWSLFQDSTYVELVILFIFDVNEELRVLIFPSDEEFSSVPFERRIDFTHYFLQQAYSQQVLFNGYRFPSSNVFRDLDSSLSGQPAIEQVVLEDPEVLRQMLRFGAVFSYYKNYTEILQSKIDPKPTKNPNYLVFLTLLKILKLNPDLLTIEDIRMNPIVILHDDGFPVPSTLYLEKYCEYVASCELLLKDISQMSFDELHKELCPKLHGLELEECLRNEDIIDFTRKFSANVIEDFQNHFIMPLSLKRISRLVIRKELNQNWALPIGIDELPISQELKVYLDIL